MAMHYPLYAKTIALIQREYLRSSQPWFLGYSGGKDSSALLKLVFLALMGLDKRTKPVTVIYCDTGVEIPLIRNLVIRTLSNLLKEVRDTGLPIKVEIACPTLENRYFVKVIGRGYPPPTNKFRWCTDRLRINPVKQVLSRVGEECVVLLGIRMGESLERDKTIFRHKTERAYYYRQSGSAKVRIFTPIIEYSVQNVWDSLASGAIPKSIVGSQLATLYWHASGECPIIHDPKGTPCAKGRFGCWTCTVVRRDHAVENLVSAGQSRLKPLLDFRNWLIHIRDDPSFRCERRRNGALGLGPFTLAARQTILTRLLQAKEESGLQLITSKELLKIKALWKEDLESHSYRES